MATSTDEPQINLDPYTFTVDGETHTIPSFGSTPAGVIRHTRRMDEADMVFTIIEHLVGEDSDALAAIDKMVGPEFSEFVQDWQRAAGVKLPN